MNTHLFGFLILYILKEAPLSIVLKEEEKSKVCCPDNRLATPL